LPVMVTNLAKFDFVSVLVGQVISNLFRPGFALDWSDPVPVLRRICPGSVLPVISGSVNDDSR